MTEDNLLAVDVFIDEEGKQVPFALRISKPRRNVEGNDYFCEICAPKLFQNPKKIYGANKSQTKKLALEFVVSLLQGRRLSDREGKTIVLDRAVDS